jgi:membrane protein implicated in regulation of membrane protease activity
MPTWLRYALFQLPGGAAAAALLLAFWDETGLPAWLGALAFAAWIAKDVALYPLLRRAYEPPAASGPERLVGSRGTARNDLRPEGQVQVQGEIWRARAVEHDAPIPAGAEVVVRAAERLTLVVERSSDTKSDRSRTTPLHKRA